MMQILNSASTPLLVNRFSKEKNYISIEMTLKSKSHIHSHYIMPPIGSVVQLR